MRMINFPSIDQFRTVVSNIRHTASYIGRDENDDPIYDPLAEMPIITFEGTVKLHGTNAGISLNLETNEMWAQSRENILTLEQDNAGFARYVDTNKEAIRELFEPIIEIIRFSSLNYIITIFGEWCGKGIQKGVAISEMPKMFVVFAVRISEVENIEFSKWLDISNVIANKDISVFNISDYPTYKIEIDFSKPDYSLQTLSDLTIQVEEECPVGKHFGISGVGEGIVWKGFYKNKNFLFKTKGEKHSKSKVKTLKVTVSPEKLDNITALVDKITPEWRLEQGLTEVFKLNNGGKLDIAKLGEFIGWVMKDIIKEESDLIASYDLTTKDFAKYVNDITKKYFMKHYNNFENL